MTGSAAEWRVAVDGAETTALFERATGTPGRALFVCAHGAGGHSQDRGMSALAEALRNCGFDLVRFNFLYREQGRRAPDTMPRLKACFDAVVARARAELAPRTLVIGGRSMGGRAASMLAAEGFACDALLLLAYPLHPAGKPDKLRDAHLEDIRVPVCCFNGTRDALCTRDLMDGALDKVGPNWEMHWLEGADHSFHVLKSSGRTDTDVLHEICDASAAWIERVAD